MWNGKSLIAITLFVFLCGCAQADDVGKAKEFIQAGMFPQAIELLNKRIEKKPTDAEAHFQLGICHIHTGNFQDANDRFASAVRLKADYGHQIGAEYKKIGDESFARKNFPAAQQAYLQAIRYQPDLKTVIFNELKDGGVKNLNKHSLGIADAYFSYLYSLDRGSGALIAEAYLNALSTGAEKDAEFNTVLVNRAIAYSQDANTRKVFSEYYYGLSQKAESTEKALKYLETANQYGNMYASELAAKKEQYELEKMLELVKINEEKYGKAHHVRVEKPNEIKKSAIIPKRTRIRYFSQSSFVIHLAPSKYVWDSATSKIGVMRYAGDSDPVIVRFEMDSKPTDIYFWVEEL